MLHVPEPPGAVELQAKRVPVAIGPDLVSGRTSVGERVARRRFPVERQPYNRAERVAEILCGFQLLPVAAGHEHVVLVRRKGDAVRVMAPAGDLGRLPPDDIQPFHIAACPCGAVERSLAHDRSARVAFTRFGPAEIDGAAADLIRRFARQEGDVAQPALAAIINPRQTGDRSGAAGRGVDEFHRARLFGDEQCIGARCELRRPGFVEGAIRRHFKGSAASCRLRRRGRLRGSSAVPAGLCAAACEKGCKG